MKLIAAVVCFLSLWRPLPAEEWTIEDFLMAERADSFDLSRDGKLAVWIKTQMDKQKGAAASNLFLTNLIENFSIRLTQGSDDNWAPRFSADGRRIAFLSARRVQQASRSETQGAQIWLMETRGGEPWRLTTLEKGVKAFEWLDNETLLAASAEDAGIYEQNIGEGKDTSIVVEDEEHASPVRLFRIDANTGTATRATDNSDRIERLSVSPDGAYAVTVHNRSLRYDYDHRIKLVTFLHDLRAPGARQLLEEGKLTPSRIAWAPDSRGFYFSAPYSSHPVYQEATIQRLYYYDLESGRALEVDLGWENGLSFGHSAALAATSDGFVALMANGVRPRLARFFRQGTGWTRSWIESPHAGNIFSLQLALDGKTVVYRHSTASVPQQWYTATLANTQLQSVRRLTELNAGWKQKTVAETEIIHWKGARDEQVEGILYFPHHHVSNRRYPLVVVIHGGPAAADKDVFAESQGTLENLMAQKGAYALRLNYHGSTEYGLKWVESIGNGNYNELEWIDVEKGVDSLIARGLVDPDQVGVAGGSNGAIITIELTTRTTRYKAASASAGDVNWITDWSNCRYGHRFGDYFLGKIPFDDPQYFIQKSPFFRMEKVRTPTIIFFGTEDKDVPTEEGWQHYRALQQFGKTDVRFLLFPGEGHGFTKLVHQRRKLEEELAWFDKYLFKTAAKQSGVLKAASLLSAALKRKDLGSVPETVLRGDIEIGRFEVTRAQYATFDPSYRFPAGTEDYPVGGISFEDARRYCEWLSKRTGQHYRLPAGEELQKLTSAVTAENTLDYWAGYTVNPDDARRLAPHIQTLGLGSLLRPVGSFPGAGDDPVFDLGGNVAEWVVSKDGKGRPVGYSADCPADRKSTMPPRPDYVGVRVVRELQTPSRASR
jgi:dipeptidyl aminopeptidase/acylaminoacyl peptidase